MEDYYWAVDREDWAYTYKNLASQTRGLFTSEDEWTQKNKWFAQNYPDELRDMKVVVKLSSSKLVEGVTADVTVNRTFKNGTYVPRETKFVYEGDSWKHLFLQDEIELFKPKTSFEEFVKAQQADSSQSSTKTKSKGYTSVKGMAG